MQKYIKKVMEYHVIPIVMMVVLFFNKFWPMLMISKYNHSNADDFWMSSGAHFVWEDTHSLWQTIVRGFDNAVLLWETWDGCFLSMFIGGLPPVVFHEDYYKYTFVVLAGALIISAIALLFTVLVRLLKFPVVHYCLITATMLILFMNFTPSAKDAWYWWVGGINYTLFTAVFFLSQAFLVEYIVSNSKICLVIGSVLAFATGLGNLLSGLINPLVLVLELVVLILVYKKDKLLFIIPAVCGLCGLLGNVLAPGNMIRGGEGLFTTPVFTTIWEAIVASIGFIPHFYRKPMIWFFLFLAVVVIDAMRKKKSPFKFRYPLIFFILSFGVYCAIFAPVIYAGSAFYGRCKNVSYFVQILVYLLNFIYITGWAFNKFNFKIKDSVAKGLVWCGLIFVLIFSSVDKEYFDSFSASESLRIGQAQDFDKKVDERFAVYYDKNVKDVVFEEIEWIPPIFYWEDCFGMLEYYFEKDSIKLQ